MCENGTDNKATRVFDIIPRGFNAVLGSALGLLALLVANIRS